MTEPSGIDLCHDENVRLTGLLSKAKKRIATLTAELDELIDAKNQAIKAGIDASRAAEAAMAKVRTLTAERDRAREREAAMMADSLLKADEIQRLKAELHLAQLKEQDDER